MDRDLLISNICRYSEERGEKVTIACKNAMVGTSFVNDIRRGQTPSVSKVSDLAAYLGITTSELLGEPLPGIPEELTPLMSAWGELNAEGKEKLMAYADDLIDSGKYKKADPPRMVEEA